MTSRERGLLAASCLCRSTHAQADPLAAHTRPRRALAVARQLRRRRRRAPVDTSAQECQAVTDAGSVVVGSGLPGDPARRSPRRATRSARRSSRAKSYMVVTANPLRQPRRLRRAEGGRHGGRRGGRGAGRARPGRAAVERPRRRRVHAALRRQDQGGRQPTTAARPRRRRRRRTTCAGSTTPPTRPRPSRTRARAAARSARRAPSACSSWRTRHHGRLAWKDLFNAGIELATDGFPISGRLAAAIDGNAHQPARRRRGDRDLLQRRPERRRRSAPTLKIPAYAATLTAIANGGADALYTGADRAGDRRQDQRDDQRRRPARRSRRAGRRSPTSPPTRRSGATPVCTTYRAYWVCGMRAAVVGRHRRRADARHPRELQPRRCYAPTGDRPRRRQAHGARRAPGQRGRAARLRRPRQVRRRHRLRAAARRQHWDAMLEQALPAQPRRPDQLRRRSMGTAQPGNLGPVPLGVVDTTEKRHDAHHDRRRATATCSSMTTTVESGVRLVPHDAAASSSTTSSPTSRRRRPTTPARRSPTASPPASGRAARWRRRWCSRRRPTARRGDFFMATGSPGGSTIIQYVVKTLVGALDWGLDAQQATVAGRLRRRQQPDHQRRRRAPERRRRQQRRQRSARHRAARARPHGLGERAVERHLARSSACQVNGAPVLTGGADPRREGVVLGDVFTP